VCVPAELLRALIPCVNQAIDRAMNVDHIDVLQQRVEPHRA